MSGRARVKVGIRFANADWRSGPEACAEFARAAESLGFESLWAVDRPAVPWQPGSDYPYSSDGTLPGYFHEIDLPDPLLWLTWAAAHTTGLGLATGVLVLPLRGVVAAAKQVATLDLLSGGRVRLAVGAGWLRDDFTAAGADFGRRFTQLEESVRALRVLWRDPRATFHGQTISFTGLDVRPRPPAGRRIPIVIGGSGPGAADRAGRLGDGFFPARGTPEQVAGLVRRARDAAHAASRDPALLEVTAGVPGPDSVRAYLRAGADRVLLAPPRESAGRGIRALESLARELARRASL